MVILNKKRIVGLSVCILATLALSPQEVLANAKEDSVKAAFVFNFIKFTTWPKKGKSLTVCSLGGGGLAKALKKSLSGKKVKSLNIKFKNVSTASKSCQVVVFGSKTKPNIGKVKSASVLTIADSKGFTNKGGIVEFTKERNKIRFIVNNKNAKKVKLKLGSNMLGAAKSVK